MVHINTLSTIDFIILLILKDHTRISGYEIDKLIEERAYRRWTDIGKSSVYVRLQILKDKECVSSTLDSNKKGRGPAPTLQSITKRGEVIFQAAQLRYLSTYPGNDVRFDLAVSGIHFLPKADAIQALDERLHRITETTARLERRRSEFDRLPLGVEWMFKRHITNATHHHQFASQLISVLKGE